jgi:hypothetical protein
LQKFPVRAALSEDTFHFIPLNIIYQIGIVQDWASI